MPDHTEPKDSMEIPSGTEMDAVKERPILFASVIIMGVMIVVGLIVVVGTIIYRLNATPDAATVAAARGQFGVVDVAVTPGTSVVRTAFLEDRLSIVTTNEGVLEVIIIDTKRGVELGRVRLLAGETVSGELVPPAAE